MSSPLNMLEIQGLDSIVKLREVPFTALLDSYTERRPGTNLYIFNLNSFAVTLSF